MSDDYFNRIADHYHETTGGQQAIYDQVAALASDLVKDKVVLDIGNGGKFAYDVRLPSKIIAMDVSAGMLDKIVDPGIMKIIGDAREMPGIADQSVDVIVFQLVLHHIAGRNPKESIAILSEILQAARRKLRVGGHLIITETLMPGPIYFFEKLLFPMTDLILKRSDVGMIFFFSRRVLSNAIASCFPHAPVFHQLKLDSWLDPFPGSFPGVFKVPAWTLPTRFNCVIVSN